MASGENRPVICHSHLSAEIAVFDGLSAFDCLKNDEDFSPTGLAGRIQNARRELWGAATGRVEYSADGSSTLTIQPDSHKLYKKLSIVDTPESLTIDLTVHGMQTHDTIALSKNDPEGYEMSGLVPRAFIPEQDIAHQERSAIDTKDITNQIGGIVLLGILEDALRVFKVNQNEAVEAGKR